MPQNSNNQLFNVNISILLCFFIGLVGRIFLRIYNTISQEKKGFENHFLDEI